MAIYVHAEVAAIARYIKGLYADIQQYYTEIPQGFQRPSFYFPRPSSSPGLQNNTMYRKEFTLNVKVFDVDKTVLAMNEVTDAIIDDLFSNKRRVLDMFDTSGIITDNKIRITSVESREITENSWALVFTWTSLYQYTIPAADLMQVLQLDVNVR